MARIPTYDQPQVEEAPLRAPRLDSVASPELLAGGAQKQGELAKGLLSAGTGAVAVGTLMQERENADMVLRAETSLKDGYIAYEREVQEKRQGRNAAGVTKDTEKWWEDQVKAHGEKLGNDEQRRMLQARITATRQSSVHGISKFEAGHLEKSWLESESASTNATIGIAVANPNPDNIANAGAAILSSTQRVADRKGWDAAVLQEKRKELFTGMHQEVFNGLLQKDYMAAKTYFEEAKKAGQIDPAKYDNFEKQLREGGKDTLAQNYGDASLAARLTLDQAIEKARKELSGPEEEHVVARLEHRYARRDSVKKGEANLLVLQGASVLQIQQSAAFRALDPGAQAEVLNTARNEELRKLQRAAAAESRADSAESRAERRLTRDGWAAYNDYSDPNVLSRMTRDQIANLLPKLGAQHTHNLLQKFDSFEKNPAKLTEARLDGDTFNRVAEDFNLEPFKNKKSAEEKARLGQVRDVVEREIGQLQAAQKKELTRDEKEKVMRQVLAREVSKPTWFGMSSEQVPAVTVLKKESVVVPEADREAITKALKARGKEPTDDAIRNWYLIAKQRGG